MLDTRAGYFSESFVISLRRCKINFKTKIIVKVRTQVLATRVSHSFVVNNNNIFQ